MVAIFCHSMDERKRWEFRSAVAEEFGKATSGCHIGYVDTVARGCRKHVGASISFSNNVIDEMTARWQSFPVIPPDAMET